ncbi:hypothetical protein HEP81_00400 [Streptomyces griseofuscus]|uniref:Uncharacterized protein n=1 Tax=Streptomyces griseofuscus TaxID=146922 RepID=A0A7H1PRQ7_9ACTN|nr:hypothetical protein HEP81_00400 [Streptomyces griseofuscus]
MTIDQDEVPRARVLLLGSGQPSRAQLPDAYRVLAEESPKTYMPKLVDALLALRHETRDPEVTVAPAAGRKDARSARSVRRVVPQLSGPCGHGAGRVGALVDHCGGRSPVAGAGAVRRAESRAAVSSAAGEPSRR